MRNEKNQKEIIDYFNSFKKLNCLTIVGNNMGNKECTKLSDALAYLKELRILNLSFNSLTDNNISKFAFDVNNKIEVLNLKGNTITDTGLDAVKNEFIKLKDYPFLSEIYFVNNKVKNFDTIKIMNSLRNLHLIDLSENPINSIKDYRKNFFDSFPRLIFLDGIGKNNELFQIINI